MTKDEEDKTRYGKSVRRKVLSENNGKPIFKDTNNSTEDFEILTTPTLKKWKVKYCFCRFNFAKVKLWQSL